MILVRDNMTIIFYGAMIVLREGLTANFEEVTVELGRCPQDSERKPSRYGISGRKI